MIEKKLLIGICLILSVAVLVSACGVSDYLGNEKGEQDYSLLTDNITTNISKDVANDSNETAVEDIKTELNKTEENESNETVNETVKDIETNKTANLEEEQKIEITDEGDIVISVYENDTVELKPQVNDADEDTLTFTFSEPLDKDGKWKTDFGDVGQYPVTVTVSDGKLETSKQVMIIVQRLNVPPVIQPIDSIVVDEGDTIELEPSIKDPNGDEFEISLSDPIGDDGVWETDYKSAGEYTEIITAEDIDGAQSKLEVPITVNKKNVAPVIEIENGDEITIDEGETVELNVNITDPNGDDIETSISEPVGDDKIWKTGYTDHGEYTITISASDAEFTTTKEITLIVNDVNLPPEIIDIINTGSGYSPECVIDGDCSGDEICSDNKCISEETNTTNPEPKEECSEDSDCEGDLVCIENSCTEVKQGCEDDNDCEGDLICVDGFCEE